MASVKALFLRHNARTSGDAPLLEIERAEGMYLYDRQGREYLDLIAGISVNALGHRHPAVMGAVKKQLDTYAHVMVYGEFVLSPQVRFAELLAKHLPAALSSVYFVNSGSEAVEGALKLAKKHTCRTEIICFENAYHGGTHGALSVMGREDLKAPFRPLLPDVRMLPYNSTSSIGNITEKTACVIAETVQGEAGVRVSDKRFMQALRIRCTETGTLLILDEIQCGMGRSGRLFAFEKFGIVPDILLLGKALGGGMPLGAFISSPEIMKALSDSPPLGHLTTFGGHPVSCAAGMAALETLLKENIAGTVPGKEKLFRERLAHPSIREVRSFGLLMAVDLGDENICKKVADLCLQNGVVTDRFLFAPGCLRISPPLIITEEQINAACKLILKSMDAVSASAIKQNM